MIYDRTITLTTGESRHSTCWRPQQMRLSELYARLAVPVRSGETLEEYLALPKEEQDRRKDVGGYVAGPLNGLRRKAGAVAGRDLVTLDLDHVPPGGAEAVVRRLEELDRGYCLCSTRKHRPEAPRLRVLLPLDRTCAPEEYGPCARALARQIGPDLADPTTFEAARLMYWPSVCADGEYLFRTADRPLHPVEELLRAGEDPALPAPPAPRQGDPADKPGLVGAFCRAYDVPAAMDRFLPGVYAPAGPGRYTFTGGSTGGGAVLYQGGKFLYSHHATDPCGGRLVNAFDLVRLHRFGDRDAGLPPDTPVHRLPSYGAMCRLAEEDPAVAVPPRAQGRPAGAEDWTGRLQRHPRTGIPLATMDNIWLILEQDPRLRGRFARNAFAGRGEVLGPLPWPGRGERRLWGESDSQGLYWYLEKYYQISAAAKIDGALALHSERHAFNEVTAYLEGLVWDGAPRLDTLFVDYLGAADTPYVRAVTRKAFTAAVARAMEPGIKFDHMAILSGPQGIGKSSLLDKMGGPWFSDAIRTFEGKEASELLQGVWIVEVAELDAFRRTDVARIKQFLSQRADRFRAAYGRHVQELPRRCVFFGTTNTGDFLQDKTGNRRFWPVDVGLQPAVKGVWRDLEGERDQLWAEAVFRWRAGESLYLSGELEAAARGEQEGHRKESPWESLVLEFLERPVPQDWSVWPLERRRRFWSGEEVPRELVPRQRVCALEIWCELLEGEKKDLRYRDSQEINGILAAAPGWRRRPQPLKFGYCGAQRGYVRG